MTTKRGQAWSDQLMRLAVCVGDLEQCDDLWLLLTAAGLDEHSLEQARSGVERVLAHLPSLKEHRVVDLGCGVGRHLFWFDALSDAMLVGIDTSRPLVECARALVPEANIVQSDIAGIGEWGAFQLVCSFAHSFFLSDSLQDFSSNLRAIRGAMHDFGLLWLEQSEVQPGELRWQAAGLVITQATEEVSPAVLSHRFTVGDAKEITTYSVRVTSDEMAELAENAGFLLEFVDRVLDDGEWITCFALRAQKG
jgi:SAM-dependent methyltransferase